MSGQWYLIYRCRWVGHNLVRSRRPIDGVYASYADAAIQIAASRNDYKTEWIMQASFCTTVEQRMQATELNDRHTCIWWTRSEFIDFMRIPVFKGNYQEKRK